MDPFLPVGDSDLGGSDGGVCRGDCSLPLHYCVSSQGGSAVAADQLGSGLRNNLGSHKVADPLQSMSAG